MSQPKRVSLKRLRWTTEILSRSMVMLKEYGHDKKPIRDIALQVGTALRIIEEIKDNEERLREKEKQNAG